MQETLRMLYDTHVAATKIRVLAGYDDEDEDSTNSNSPSDSDQRASKQVLSTWRESLQNSPNAQKLTEFTKTVENERSKPLEGLDLKLALVKNLSEMFADVSLEDIENVLIAVRIGKTNYVIVLINKFFKKILF